MYKEIKISLIGRMPINNENGTKVGAIPITSQITLHNGECSMEALQLLMKHIIEEIDNYMYANVYFEFYGNKSANHIIDGIAINKERSGNYTILKYSTEYSNYSFVVQSMSMTIDEVYKFAINFIEKTKRIHNIDIQCHN